MYNLQQQSAALNKLLIGLEMSRALYDKTDNQSIAHNVQYTKEYKLLLPLYILFLTLIDKIEVR